MISRIHAENNFTASQIVTFGRTLGIGLEVCIISARGAGPDRYRRAWREVCRLDQGRQRPEAEFDQAGAQEPHSRRSLRGYPYLRTSSWRGAPVAG